jgi:hypothetical protein
MQKGFPEKRSFSGWGRVAMSCYRVLWNISRLAVKIALPGQ